MIEAIDRRAAMFDALTDIPLATKQTRIGRIALAENNGSIERVYFEHAIPPKACCLPPDTELSREAFRQIDDFLAKKRQTFDLPLTRSRTESARKVDDFVTQLAYGETCTLGDAGARLDLNSLQIGKALADHPLPLLVPCHRLVPKRLPSTPNQRVASFVRTLEAVHPIHISAPSCLTYDEVETTYLASCDDSFARAVELLGFIERSAMSEPFEALISCIVGQQISSKALSTIWSRLQNLLYAVTPESIQSTSFEDIQKCGMTMRKANYIKEVADAVAEGRLRLESFETMSDEAIREELVALPGIGVWTAEMLMIFSLRRKHVVSWGDLAIRRGMMYIYRAEVLSRRRFEHLADSYYPCGTVASLYFWAASVHDRNYFEPDGGMQ
ncbi:MAG: hypothetical protein HGA54_01080 [Actinobacteria bacterium]|nr:hypothetical protein [Actinomycetota bacterium]